MYEELRELFRPILAKRLEPLMEQLLSDEGFFAEAQERFEEGYTSNWFPALSAALSHRSMRDRVQFLKTVGLEAMSSLLPQKELWDDRSHFGSLEEYRRDLYEGGSYGLPYFDSHAVDWLTELLRVGYHGVMAGTDLPLKQQPHPYYSPINDPVPVGSTAVPISFENSRQVLWLQLDGWRSFRKGYREIRVADEPLRTDKGILAALTALEGYPIDVDLLRQLLAELKLPLGESMYKQMDELRKETPSEQWGKGGLLDSFQKVQRSKAIDYMVTLLKYHRRGFDELTQEQTVDLIAQTCAHINEFLEGLRKLMLFLEYGQPGQRTKVAAKDADRDVIAAVLRDVDGMTYREIGKELSISPPKNFDYKGDHPTVRKMVSRGRGILERTLGKEGWQRQIRTMKAEKERYFTLSEEERDALHRSEWERIPFEEALRCVKEEARLKQQRPRDTGNRQ
jgi:hypothetical protein